MVGGGAMGCGIALEFAIAGRRVTLFNTRRESSARAQARMEHDAALLVETGLLSSERASAALGHIRRTTVLAEAAADQDFVIESIPEDLALKQQLFGELDRLAAPGTLLASNTTALSVTALARDCSRPERVLSAHYYLPAHLIPLVDVIPGEKTAPEALEATRLLLEEVGKTPVVFARDVPGSVGPRLQQALMGEALRLVQEGVATPEMVDRVLTQGIGRRFGVTGIFPLLWLRLAAQHDPLPGAARGAALPLARGLGSASRVRARRGLPPRGHPPRPSRAVRALERGAKVRSPRACFKLGPWLTSPKSR